LLEGCCDHSTDCVYYDNLCVDSDTLFVYSSDSVLCYESVTSFCNSGDEAGTLTGSYCCGGTSPEWILSAEVLTEDQYSCSDGLDNDCDELVDEDDPDCL